MAVSAATLTHALTASLRLESPQNSNLQNRKNQTKNAEKPPETAVFLSKLVGVRGLEPRASCSQSRRATNCATPRFLFPGQREVFPKSMPCICLHLKKHAVFPKCSCLYSITDFSEKCQLHLSIQSPTKTCKNAKPPAPSPFSSKKNGEEEKQGHSFSPFTIPF